MGKVYDFISRTIRKRAMHVTLLDPDTKKLHGLKEKVEMLEEFGTDAILIGGSTNISQNFLDKSIQAIKKNSSLPVILFPGGLNGISRHADAIFFMSLLNSRDPYWITGAQASGAPLIKRIGIEPIPMAYVIIEPGMRVGEVGKADLISRNEAEKAAGYALAAQYMGMSLVYLEAGSGADMPVPAKMIKDVRKSIKIPIIVGGGIRSAKQAKECVKAGADIIDTGTITEENFESIESIIKAVISFRR